MHCCKHACWIRCLTLMRLYMCSITSCKRPYQVLACAMSLKHLLDGTLFICPIKSGLMNMRQDRVSLIGLCNVLQMYVGVIHQPALITLCRKQVQLLAFVLLSTCLSDKAFVIYAPSYGFNYTTQQTVSHIDLCDVLKMSVIWGVVLLPNSIRAHEHKAGHGITYRPL